MRKIDVNGVIDNARFTPFHWNVLFWCTLIIIFDGYDLVIYGVVLPLLMEQWQLSPVAAGALGSAALFGMMFGAMFFGTLSDKLGRKKVILLCVILFSVTTMINGFANSPWQFGILRFIAGLGIGGVMPNVVALMTEYSPKRSRSTLMFWTAFFMCLLMVYALGFWLPKLMSTAGYALSSSLMFLMVLNVGAIVGPLLGGSLLALALPHHLNVVAFAIPGVIAALAVFNVSRRIPVTLSSQSPVLAGGSHG